MAKLNPLKDFWAGSGIVVNPKEGSGLHCMNYQPPLIPRNTALSLPKVSL